MIGGQSTRGGRLNNRRLALVGNKIVDGPGAQTQHQGGQDEIHALPVSVHHVRLMLRNRLKSYQKNNGRDRLYVSSNRPARADDFKSAAGVPRSGGVAGAVDVASAPHVPKPRYAGEE